MVSRQLHQPNRGDGMNVFHLRSESYSVGEKVLVKNRSGESFAAEIKTILGPHLTMRRIEESELGKDFKIFPTPN